MNEDPYAPELQLVEWVIVLMVSRIGSTRPTRTATHQRPLADLATDASEVVHVWTMDTVQQQGHPLYRALYLFIEYGVIANSQCSLRIHV